MDSRRYHASKSSKKSLGKKMRRFGFFTMSFLSILIVIYAAGMYVFGPSAAGLWPEIENNFRNHSVVFGIHIFTSGLALLLGPFQLSSAFRNRWPNAHRLIGQTYLGVGVLVGGVAGLYMSTLASGGTASKLGFACLAVAWLATGYKGYISARAGNIFEHKRWMIRNYAVTFAAVTFRLYLPLAVILKMPIEIAYPVITWLCWITNLLVAQLFLSSATRSQHWKPT